jgi:hypothetical protein
MYTVVYALVFVIAVVVVVFLAGIRIVRPTHRGLVERPGKYRRFAEQGFIRKLEAVEKSLCGNAKIVIPSGSELVNVIGEMAGVLPLTEAS